MPSVSLKHSNDFVAGNASSELDPSLDAYYKITPSLTAALTLNTDFSATEVDDRQVNLTRFSLFLPEKRQFFNQDLDIHKATAAEVFGVDVLDVKDYQRRNAKAINFGLIYGMSAFGLSRQLNISQGDAKEYISLYFERYPGVRDYNVTVRRP